jgi:hypothetical protein
MKESLPTMPNIRPSRTVVKQLRHPPLKPEDAIGYTEFYSRSHDSVIRVYDESGNVIETHEHAGGFKKH